MLPFCADDGLGDVICHMVDTDIAGSAMAHATWSTGKCTAARDLPHSLLPNGCPLSFSFRIVAVGTSLHAVLRHAATSRNFTNAGVVVLDGV